MWRGLQLLSTLALVAGCTGRSEILLGVATDLQAPDALDHAHLSVTRVADGSSLLEVDWPIAGKGGLKFQLPGSFGIFTDDGSEPRLAIRVTGSKDGQELVHRDALTSIVREHTLFMRLALVASCATLQCGSDETCIEGRCRPNDVPRVQLNDYRPNLERFVICQSAAPLIDTASGGAMDTDGPGYCDEGEWCGEGTCYKNAGQGLLFCAPQGSWCTGVDGYERCAIAACEAPLERCYGPGWREGTFGGPCAELAACRKACDCQAACLSSCDARLRPAGGACDSCLITDAGPCLAQTATGCRAPVCMPKN